MHLTIKSIAGFSMLEVLIAALVGAVGVAGIVGMQMKSIQIVGDTGNRTHAMMLASDLRNRMRANRVAADDYVIDNMSCTGQIPTVKLCSSHHNGSEIVPADDTCSNSDLALFDLVESLCGIGTITSSDGYSSAGTFISDPQLTIEALPDGDFSVDISWSTRIGGTDANDERQYYVADGTVADVQRDNYTLVFRP